MKKKKKTQKKKEKKKKIDDDEREYFQTTCRLSAYLLQPFITHTDKHTSVSQFYNTLYIYDNCNNHSLTVLQQISYLRQQ